jgi:hypothetical protein
MTYPPKIYPTRMPSSAGSLVNQFLSLAQEKPKSTPGGSGPSSSESFAEYDPESCLWKTSQGSLLPEWATFSATWPRSGMTRNGKAYPLPRLVPPISAGDFLLLHTPTAKANQLAPSMIGRHPGGWWPTPTADLAEFPLAPATARLKAQNKHRPSGAKIGTSLRHDPRIIWPSPKARDGRSARSPNSTRQSPDLNDEAVNLHRNPDGTTTGQLNPTWVEWLMGFPAGWTDLED